MSYLTTVVPASGPLNARIAVVGMAPAKEEVRLGKPFMGESGRILNEDLSYFACPRDSVFVTNCIDHPIVGQSIFEHTPADELARQTNRLERELLAVNPNVIIPLGNDPLTVLCGKDKITKWRGSILESTLLPGKKCVPSIHPAWIIRGQWKWRAVFRHVDLKRALEESKSPDINLPKRSVITGPSFNDAVDYLGRFRKHSMLCFDIETRAQEIACVGLAYRPDEAICIPFMRANGTSYWTLEEEAVIWQKLALLLESDIPKIGQNLAFDWLFFWHHKIFPRNMWIDTMLLHHCLYPDFGKTRSGISDSGGAPAERKAIDPGHGLGFICSQYTRTPFYKDDGRHWNPSLGEHTLWEYCGKDAMIPIEAGLQMFEEAKENGLLEVYESKYRRPFLHALRMEYFGIAIDESLRAEALVETDEYIAELTKQINEQVGYDLNVNSPKQVKHLLYDVRGYQIKKHRTTGAPTANKETLEYFAESKDDYTLQLIVKLRNIKDLRSDILVKPLLDSRIHSHYRIGGTLGARWSSAEPIFGIGTNLQNIPRKGVARRLFLPS